jgi:hypothetical protein
VCGVRFGICIKQPNNGLGAISVFSALIALGCPEKFSPCLLSSALPNVAISIRWTFSASTKQALFALVTFAKAHAVPSSDLFAFIVKIHALLSFIVH